MSLPARLQQQALVAVDPATSTDAHGNDVADYGPAATRTPFTGWVQQDQRDETFPDGRNPLEQRWLLMTSYQALTGRSRVEWAGHPGGPVTFEVWGQPEPAFRAPTGTAHHAEITLRLLEG